MEETAAAHTKFQTQVQTRTTLAERLEQAAADARKEHESDPDDDALAQAAAKADEAVEAARLSLTKTTQALAATAEQAGQTTEAAAATRMQSQTAVAGFETSQQVALALASKLSAADDQFGTARQLAEQAAQAAGEATSLVEQRTTEVAPFNEKAIAAKNVETEALGKLTEARNQAAKWEAALINVQRIEARDQLAVRQSELDQLAMALAAEQASNDAAVAQLEEAQTAMTAMPAAVKLKQDELADARRAAGEAQGQLEAAKASVSDKQAFFAQFENTVSELVQHADKEPENETLAQAVATSAQSIELLKRDLEGAGGA